MTAVHDGCQSAAGGQGPHHYSMQHVVHNSACALVIHWVDRFVVAIVLVAVQILGLTTMSTEVEEEPINTKNKISSGGGGCGGQYSTLFTLPFFFFHVFIATANKSIKKKNGLRVIGSCVPDEPLHGGNHVGLCWDLGRVLLVVGQGNTILLPEPVLPEQERLDVAHVVDTASELVALAEVVDTDEQGPLAALAVGQLKVNRWHHLWVLVHGPALGWWRHIGWRNL